MSMPRDFHRPARGPQVLEDHGVLERRLHTAFDGIPYYDEVLDVPQSRAHRIFATNAAPLFEGIAEEAGLVFLSDEPIWYFHPETQEQRVYSGDAVFARATDRMRITADDLLLVLEVVSTNDRRKERKDEFFQRLLNEYNGVPEFALVYPDLDDARALSWCRLVGERYQDHQVAPGGAVASERVPGLELRVRPREAWAPGHKIDVYFRGTLRGRAVEEFQRAEQEKQRAEQEKQRAEQEKQRAEQEKQRAEQLAAQLRALGVDPNQP